MFDNYDDILTLEQLTEILAIGRNTAYRLLQSGELKGFLLGNKWRVTRQALEDYILSKYQI